MGWKVLFFQIINENPSIQLPLEEQVHQRAYNLSFLETEILFNVKESLLEKYANY